MTKIDSFIVCRINLDEINGFLVTGVLARLAMHPLPAATTSMPLC